MPMTLLLLSLLLTAAVTFSRYCCFAEIDAPCRRMKEAATTSPTWSTRHVFITWQLLQVSLFLVLPLYIPCTSASTSHHETPLNSEIECLFSSSCKQPHSLFIRDKLQQIGQFTPSSVDSKSNQLPTFIKETANRNVESEEAVQTGSEGEVGSITLRLCVHQDIPVTISSEVDHRSNLSLTWSGINYSSNSVGSIPLLYMPHHAEYFHYRCFDKDVTGGDGSSYMVQSSLILVHVSSENLLNSNLDKLQNSISFDSLLCDIAVTCQNTFSLQSEQASEELKCNSISLTEDLIKSGILSRDCNCSNCCSYNDCELFELMESRIVQTYINSEYPGLKISATSKLHADTRLTSSKNKAFKIRVSGYTPDQMLSEEELYLEELSRRSSGNSVLDTHMSDPFNKLQKLVGKVFLVTLFYVLVMVLKILRQEGSVSTDCGLWHSCSYTFFLQSSYPKAGLVRSTNNVHHLHDLNCKSWLPSTTVKTELSNNSNLKERFTGLLGSIFRWFFDYETTTLKVRVQISESPSIDVSPNVGCAAEDDMFINQESINIESNDVSDFINSSDIHQKSQETIEQESMLHHSPASCASQASLGEQDFSVTVKKDKSKRRKKKGNVNDLIKDNDRGTRSGSSSPPSSPASPATPIFNGSNNPFTITRTDSYASAVKGNALYTLSRNHMSRGTLHKGNLSTLDVHDVHFHKEKNLQHSFHSLSPRITAKPGGLKTPSTTANNGGGISATKDYLADKAGTPVSGENWAAVARRAVASSGEPDKAIKNGSLKKDGAHNQPVLLSSASFPQGGQRMRWTPRIFGEKLIPIGDPICNKSLAASSLVAPEARAPGSKLVKNCTGKSSCQGAVTGSNSERCDDVDVSKKHNSGHEADDLLYDIWGNHFCQFSQTPGLLESSPLRNIPSPITAGFSIFSCDTIFPPQLEDNASVPKSAVEH